MTPTLESLQQLADSLPELDFRSLPDQSGWLRSEPVESYLDHYHINFSAENLCQKHNLGKFLAAGFENAVHIWQARAARGTIFLVHGFTDSVGLMQHPIRFFLQRGWSVVAFDLPGHGLSSGAQASIDSFDQYRDVLTVCLQHCQQTMTRPWHGVGQSTGAAVWLNYLSAYSGKREIEKILLAAPLVRPAKWNSLRLVLPAYSSLSDKVRRKFKINSHDAEFVDFIKYRDPLQTRITPMRWASAMADWITAFSGFPVLRKPLTIIQGDADDTVDFRFNVPLICEKFPRSALIMVKGARHQLFNESEAFRQIIFSHIEEWLNSPLQPPPVRRIGNQ